MTPTFNQAPSVLFVCVRNGGKSQMAAALMRLHAGTCVAVHSAGTDPGETLNEMAVRSIEELGASLEGENPQPIEPGLFRSVDRVIVLGGEAQVVPIAGMIGSIVTWHTDEPSERGITGIERMRLVRDDINERVKALINELLPNQEKNA